jgi:hypothetical protein
MSIYYNDTLVADDGGGGEYPEVDGGYLKNIIM